MDRGSISIPGRPYPTSSRLAPAAALLARDLTRFALPAGDLKAFHQDLAAHADVIPATVLLESLLPEAEAPGAPAPRRVRLTHLPFWEISFGLGRSNHKVWLDAAGGQMLPLSAPASACGRLDATYSAVMAGTFLALFLGFAALFSGGGLSFLGLTLVVLGGPMAWALARFTIARAEGR